MKTVYLVRHGESEWNANPVFSDTNSPLTERGIQQARKAGERLMGTPIETIISSEMVRAQQTAQAIQSVISVPIETSALFNERIFPDALMGMEKSDPRTKEAVAEWDKSLDGRGVWNGEGDSFETLRDRADAAITFIESHPAHTLVVVSHAYFMRIFLARALYGKTLTPEHLGPFLWNVREDNASISTLVFDPEDTVHWSPWRMEQWSDECHLKDI